MHGTLAVRKNVPDSFHKLPQNGFLELRTKTVIKPFWQKKLINEKIRFRVGAERSEAVASLRY